MMKVVLMMVMASVVFAGDTPSISYKEQATVAIVNPLKVDSESLRDRDFPWTYSTIDGEELIEHLELSIPVWSLCSHPTEPPKRYCRDRFDFNGDTLVNLQDMVLLMEKLAPAKKHYPGLIGILTR